VTTAPATTTTVSGSALPFTGNGTAAPVLGLLSLLFGGALWLVARRRHAVRS
jgi:hypothetical protein